MALKWQGSKRWLSGDHVLGLEETGARAGACARERQAHINGLEGRRGEDRRRQRVERGV